MALASQKCVLEQNSQLPIPLKVWVYGFLSVNRNEKIGVSHYKKIRKMALAPQKFILEQNFQLLNCLKLGPPVFQVSTETENWQYQTPQKDVLLTFWGILVNVKFDLKIDLPYA